MELKIWILSSVVLALVAIVVFVIKLIIAYVKKEMSILNISVNNHSVELAKNTEQLKSLFKLISTITKSNDGFEKRITKLEIDNQATKERCNIYHNVTKQNN